MASRNPYAPPRATSPARPASAVVSTEIAVWRAGKEVICLQGSALPARCVKCNAPAELPTREREMYWVSSWVYLLIFAGLLPLLIVYLIVRKKAYVNPGLCGTHKKRQVAGTAIGWVAPIAGTPLLFYTSVSIAFAIAGIILIIVGIVFAFAWARSIYAKRIDDVEIRLAGFCNAYLDDLPQYPY